MKRLGLLRSLLQLYPARFRDVYGEQALRLLRADLSEAREKGGIAYPLRILRHLGEFAIHGLLERVSPATTSDGQEPGRVEPDRPSLLQGFGHDLRFALRAAARQPLFLLIAVLSLAIGVATTTAMFSVVETVLLRPIPGVDEPERILLLVKTKEGRPFRSFDHPTFQDIRAGIPALGHVAMYDIAPVNLSDGQYGEQLLAMHVTSGYFEALGVRMARGRTFLPEEDVGPGAHPLVILSDETWRDRFQADPDILGRTLRLNREPHTIVGVAPPTFRGHTFGSVPAVFVPLTQHARVREAPERFLEDRGTEWGRIIGRMGPGTGTVEVDAALATLSTRLAAEFPETNTDVGARATIAGLLDASARGDLAIAASFITALLTLVLAATCANVAGMLLARASTRERELAIRLALGAGRARVVRHLTAESMIVFVLGGAAGILLAYWGVRGLDLNRILPVPVPVTLDLVFDGRVVLFGTLLTLTIGSLFGVLPALGATPRDAGGSLRDRVGGDAPRAQRLRRVFVGGQVCVSVVLLVSAGLFIRSAQVGKAIDAGLDPTGIWTTRLDLSLEGYGDEEVAVAFVDRLLEQLRGLPEVAQAAVTTDIPFDGGSVSTPIWPGLRAPGEEPSIFATYGRVTPGYFETLRLAPLRGRLFGPGDAPSGPRVAVVDSLLAALAWPGEEPVGRTIEVGLEPEIYTVIGVVPTIHTRWLTDGADPQVFTLLSQDFEREVDVLVRQAGDSPGFPARLRQGMLSVDSQLGLPQSRALEDFVGLGTLPHRLAATVAGALGLVALLLCSIGVYGIIAFSVARRTKEIGVRIALGASRTQVIRRVVRGAFGLALPGIGVGLFLAVGVGHILRSVFLFVSPLDPPAYLSVVGLLAIVVLLASMAPARRASAVQPVEALGSE